MTGVKKILLQILSALVIGALGIPVWDYLLAPSSSWLLHVLLNISTLGIESYKNIVYLKIARGLHESSSLGLLLIIIGTMVGLILVIVLALLLRKSNREVGVLHHVFLLNHKMMTSRTFLIFYTISLLSLSTLLVAQEMYINNAVTYYNQLLETVTPNINDAQYKVFNSRFAQIRSQRDYISLTKDLRGIATTTALTLPPSISIW